jgi:hypothetical protein
MQSSRRPARGDQDAWRFGEPDEFTIAMEQPNAGADFNSASSDFKALGAFFCNFVLLEARQPEWRTVSLRPCTTSCRFEVSEPNHFRARIQSFQAVAAPFPGDPAHRREPDPANGLGEGAEATE